jgi:HAMP domain-containing protein
VESHSPEDVERLRRSHAMLQPGAPGLKREDAIQMLTELQRLQGGLKAMVEECQRLLAG